ncbi:MAG: chorismate mutase [Succinivibrio sp.]|nr:chorismate mutase [Succinivibrio sp.]
MRNLTQCREQIDAVDQQILQLLKERNEIARDIAQCKLESDQAVTDAEREEQKLSGLGRQALKEGLSASYVRDVFKTIISHTVAYEKRYIVDKINEGGHRRSSSIAFLGTVGTYSHLAARRFLEHYGDNVTEHGCDNFEEVTASVECGRSAFGVLPVENSSSGSINEVLDVLQEAKVHLVGEVLFPIDHSILAIGQLNLDEITDVYSHPQPVTQCSRWLKDFLPKVNIHYTKSSSDALSTVRDLHKKGHVCIASHHAADYYGLTPLADDIANNVHNYTRFVAIAKEPIVVPNGVEAKTSLSFSVEKYTPGSLIGVLTEFQRQGINLDKLISRPRLDHGSYTWEEIFFVDVQANVASPKMQEILERIGPRTSQLKILGCYPSTVQRS